MSDFRDSRGREIAGPLHFLGSLIEDEIVKGQQKKAQKQQAADRRDALRRQRRQDRMNARERRRDPVRKSLRHALIGAGVLTPCLWFAPVLLPALWRVPQFWLLAAVWAFATLAGLWALFVGLGEAHQRVPQDLMPSYWSAWVLVGIGVLFLKFVPADATAVYLVRGVYVTGFAVVAVYFWIVSGLGVVSARRRVKREINRRNAPMRPVLGGEAMTDADFDPTTYYALNRPRLSQVRAMLSVDDKVKGR